jgi:very-short-patch-repair endonuclease
VLSPRTDGAVSDALAWVEKGVRLLADLAMAQPLLSLCLVVEPDLFRAYLEQAKESRVKALARESVVTVAANELWHSDGPRNADPSGGTSALSQSITRLAAGGASAELSQFYEDAFQAVSELGPDTCDPAGVERARSAAERFLFERLETLPQTAGLFHLNQTLGFRFGPCRDSEVDICAQSLDLVIEIDGYFHFQDPESYRRDRRKDLELQKNGYMVFRVLAEDVVSRLEEILAMILAIVAFQRARIVRS